MHALYVQHSIRLEATTHHTLIKLNSCKLSCGGNQRWEWYIYMWLLNPALVVMGWQLEIILTVILTIHKEMLVDSQDAWVHPLTLKSEAGHVTPSDPCS